MARHVGKLVNTGSRIAVLYMQIPGKEDYSLIVETDTLPDQYQDILMTILESPEGQADLCFADVLGRTAFGDYGRNGLEALHYLGVLRREPVSNVMMYPEPNQGILLTELLKIMGKAPSTRVNERVDNNEYKEYTENIYKENAEVSDSTNKVGVAKNLIIEAKMLEDEAMVKREKAYAMCPELRPVAHTAPVVKEATTLPETKSKPRGRPAKVKAKA